MNELNIKWLVVLHFVAQDVSDVEQHTGGHLHIYALVRRALCSNVQKQHACIGLRDTSPHVADTMKVSLRACVQEKVDFMAWKHIMQPVCLQRSFADGTGPRGYLTCNVCLQPITRLGPYPRPLWYVCIAGNC
jgi:hypothetical protein